MSLRIIFAVTCVYLGSALAQFVLNSVIDVEVVISERDLGIMISNGTPWKARVVMIVAKANKMLGFLKSNLRRYVGSAALLRL